MSIISVSYADCEVYWEGVDLGGAYNHIQAFGSGEISIEGLLLSSSMPH